MNHAVHAMADPGNSQTAFQSDPRISLLVISPLVTAFLFLGWAHCLQILTQAPHSTTVQMDTELVEKITFKQSKQHPVERFNQLGGCLVTWEKVSRYGNFCQKNQMYSGVIFSGFSSIQLISCNLLLISASVFIKSRDWLHTEPS